MNSPALRSVQTGFASQKRTPWLDPRASRALVAVLDRGLTRRRRLGFIRAAARPCAALQPPRWRIHRGTPPSHLQRRARPGRGANEAQAPAVDGLAAQRRLRAPTGAERAARTFHARKTCLSRNAVKASCFARAARPFSAGNSVESRAAALPNAVAIAPRPGRARRCREVKERPRRGPAVRGVAARSRSDHAAARPCAALPRGQGATTPRPGRARRCREVKERPRRGPAMRGVAARSMSVRYREARAQPHRQAPTPPRGCSYSNARHCLRPSRKTRDF